MTWNSGLSFSYSVIVESAQHGIETYKSIIILHEEYEKKILTLGARSKNAEKLLQQMYMTPILSVRSVEKVLEISFSSANRLLKSLEEMGILTQIKGHSQGQFVCS